ncbi:hypothetical protein GGI12_005993 [Dipsacomyces acuminosporus]|nr:hypothetical protein GGI12_005993 [Dipsacomyces acuminosporus]
MIMSKFVVAATRTRRSGRSVIQDEVDVEKNFVGIVEYYFEHSLNMHVNGARQDVVHQLACVQWLKPHSKRAKYEVDGVELDAPIAEVWSTRPYKRRSQPIIPITRISHRCAYTRYTDFHRDLDEEDSEETFIVVPMDPKIDL